MGAMTTTFMGTVRNSGFSLTYNGLDGTRELRSKFRVRTTDAPSLTIYGNVLACLASNGISIASFSAIDGGVWITAITVTIEEPRNLASAGGARCWDWIADVTGSSKAPDKPENQEDPTLRAPTIKFYTAKWTSPALHTITSDVLNPDGSLQVFPIENSAGDPVTRERLRATVVIKIGKTFNAFDPANVCEAPLGYLYSRNKYVWNPIPEQYQTQLNGYFNITRVQPGEGRIEDMEVSTLFANGQQYAHVEMEVHVERGKFRDRVIDQGYTYLKPDGTRTPFFVNGQFATTPQNLDGNGHPLTPIGGVSPPGTTPEIRSYQYYRVMDWADLSMP